MKKVFVIFVAVMAVFSCSQQENKLKPKRTVIAGAVNNFSVNAHLLVINYCDPFSDKQQFTQDLIESNGFFQTEHEYVFAQNLTIRFANRFINCIVHPGDSIFITIDANEMERNFDNAITFSGDNSKINKELFVWYNYWANSPYKQSLQFDYSALPEDFLTSVKQNFDMAQDSIQAYSKRTNMSDFVKKWAFIDHKYVMANYFMDYNNENANRWEVFTNPIFDVYNEDNFQTMCFPYHLDVCMIALMKTNLKIPTSKNYVSEIRLTIEQLFEKAPEGIVRDCMAYQFLKIFLGYVPEYYGSELYDSISAMKIGFSQDLFNNELGKILEKTKRRIEQTEQIPKVSEVEKQLDGILYMTNSGDTEELPSVKVLNHLTEKYTGKVLYIDVWATWCGPCIHEFTFTPNLHKYFKSKDVVFVNLCLASDLGSWKPAIMKNNVVGENYFLRNNATELFRTEHNLPGYPSYLIIDKNGKIHNPVPRPSDLELAIQKIESCLK